MAPGPSQWGKSLFTGSSVYARMGYVDLKYNGAGPNAVESRSPLRHFHLTAGDWPRL